MTDTAQPQKPINSTLGVPVVPPAPPSVPIISKESEPIKIAPANELQPVPTEVKLPKEVAEIGTVEHKDLADVPPDLQILGVSPTGLATAPPATTALPNVTLPISDQQVITGLHAQMQNAIHWLAIWCLKKLKKAHLILKVVHGKIIRVNS